MNWLDIFLSGFQWYRKQRKGLWVYLMHKRIHGCPSWWERSTSWWETDKPESIVILQIDDFS